MDTKKDEVDEAAQNDLTEKCKSADKAYLEGNFELAQELLASVLLQVPTGHVSPRHMDMVRAEVFFQIGRLHHQKQEWEKAFAEYKQALEYCQKVGLKNLSLHYMIAQVCAARGRSTDAIGYLEATRSKRLKRPDIWRALAQCYLQGQKAEQAFECATKALELDADDTATWLLYVEAALSAKRANDANAGLPAEGITQTEESLQMWANLGTLRLEQHNLEAAKHAYEKASAIVADNKCGVADLAVRLNQAVLEEHNSQPHAAIQQHLTMCEEHSWFGHGFLKVGYMYELSGDVERAMQVYKEARPTMYVEANLMLAELYRSSGKVLEAAKTVNDALLYSQRRGKGRQSSYLSVLLGNLYYEQANANIPDYKDKKRYLRSALEMYLQAIPNSSDSYHAVNGLGMVFASAGNTDMAQRIFHSVSEHMAHDISIHINLGHSYVKLGGVPNLQKAIKYYESALKLQPASVEVKTYLANACYGMRDYERVTALLSEAADSCPDDLLLRYNMARCMERHAQVLTAAEVEKKRSVGLDAGLANLEKAIGLAKAAVKLYKLVERRWKSSDAQRKSLLERAPPSIPIKYEMGLIADHVEFCEKQIIIDAENDYDRQKELKEHQEAKMQMIHEEKARKQREEQEAEEHEKEEENQRYQEIEEQALRLMEGARDIDLGKDLESKYKENKGKAPAKRTGEAKEAKGAKAARTEQAGAEVTKEEPEDEDKMPLTDRDEERDLFGDDGEEDEARLEPTTNDKKDKKDKKKGKKDKKNKKDKKDKKEKKAKKDRVKEEDAEDDDAAPQGGDEVAADEEMEDLFADPDD